MKRERILAFFLGWEISIRIASEEAFVCATLELAAEKDGACGNAMWAALELAPEKIVAFLSASGDSNLGIVSGGRDIGALQYFQNLGATPAMLKAIIHEP